MNQTDLTIALHSAAAKGCADSIRSVLDGGAYIHAKKDGQSPLSLAANTGCVPAVRILVERGNINQYPMDHDAVTALILATTRGHSEVVEFLLEMGANIESRSKKEDTPLMRAITHNRYDVAEMLLSKGANPEAVNIYGDSALFRAICKRSTELIDLLLDSGASRSFRMKGFSPMTIAAKHGSTEMVQHLIDRGFDINAKDSCGCTPIHGAITSLNPEVVRLLIVAGAHVGVVDESMGRTALSLAVCEGSLDIVKLLIECGVNVNSADDNGETPLICASYCDDTELVDYLLDEGADITCTCHDGCTALHAAAQGGCIDIVKVLLSRGADINACTSDGDEITPVDMADAYENYDVVRFLLDRGAVSDFQKSLYS